MKLKYPHRIFPIAFAALLLLISACEREFDNPWDDKSILNPDAWAPQNFQVEDISITEKKLTWSYEDKNIEGFKLDRKKGDEPWQVGFQTFTKETRSWNDTDITPNPALSYSYRLYTYAGKNLSSEKNSTTNVEFPAPTGLQIEKVTDISYKITWQDNSTGEEGFKIDRKTAGNDWVIGFAAVGANITAFNDTNVFVGKSSIDVEYRVYAFYKEFESEKTEANTNAALTPPSNLTITQNSITSITLSWQINSTGEKGFIIERRYTGGNWTEIETTTANSYNDSNFELNTQVYYRVSAYMGQYQSSYAESSFNSQIPAPSDLQLEKLSDVSYKLTWKDNSIGEQGFRIDRRTGENPWVLGYGQVDENITSFTDPNVFLEKTALPVYYRVYVIYEHYTSDNIATSTNATLTPPTNLQITQNSLTSVTLNWQNNSTGEDGYKMERRYEGGNWEEIATTTTNSYHDNTFLLNTQVYYRLSGYSGQFQSAFVETNFDANIPPPSNFQITKSTITSVTLAWQNNTIGEEGFRIERKQGSGNWEVLTTLTGTNYIDATFDLNTDVSYQITAYYGKYYSGYVEKSFNSQIPPPENFVLTPNSATSITLNWDYIISGHEGFMIERKIDNQNWVVLINNLNPGQNNFTDQGVDLLLHNYTYRIYAFVGTYASAKPEEMIGKIQIGSFIFGGIVFYLDGNGGGLVFAENEQSTAAQWGCQGTAIGGTGTEIGTGASNTTSIVSGCSQSGIAARICYDLNLNGYNDWFLPSKDELYLMHQNLVQHEIDIFSDDYIWSSSEYNANTAWVYVFSMATSTTTNKFSNLRVRAIRAF